MWNQIRDKLPYPFEDMGEQSVKNIARPVRVFAMSTAAVAASPSVAVPAQPTRASRGVGARFAGLIAGRWARPTAQPSSSPPVASTGGGGKPATASAAPQLSIVVLPFANLSNDPEQEYFADGITDDLTTDLSRISGSFVIARNTAFAYKAKSVDARQVGRELGVRYVLEGSVRRVDDEVRVNVQMIDAETGTHLWADRFDTNRQDLAAAQSEITGRLARTLNLEIEAAAVRRIEQEKAVDPDARDFVMRGWAWVHRPVSVAARQEAQRAFERALEIDPRSVDARIGVATVLVENMVKLWSSSAEQDQARAEQLLLEALERDANRSTAHYAMGMLRRTQDRLAEAQIDLEQATALDPNDADAISELAQTLMFLSQPEAAIPQFEKAMRLSPRDPNFSIFYWGLGACHLLLRHVDKAIDLLRNARAANPRLWYVYLWLAGALGLRGDLDEARAALAESIKLKPEINSLAQYRALVPWGRNPDYVVLREKTLHVGLRRAGFPDE